MAFIIKDIRQSPLESAGWFFGSAGLAVIGIWGYNQYFGGDQILTSWKSDLEKELEIDTLKINKTLCFGTQTRRCAAHDQGQELCTDLDCTFGPFGHLMETLNSAKKSVDVAIFSFTSKVMGDAIVEAHQRGVRVRVVTDAESAFSSHSPLIGFRECGIPVRQRISPFHMHHKFIILDGELLVNGSMNFSNAGTFGNWENIIITSDPGLVVPFVREFETLWDDFEQGKELKFRVEPDRR